MGWVDLSLSLLVVEEKKGRVSYVDHRVTGNKAEDAKEHPNFKLWVIEVIVLDS